MQNRITLTVPPGGRSTQRRERIGHLQGRRKSPPRHVIYAAFSVTKLESGAQGPGLLAWSGSPGSIAALWGDRSGIKESLRELGSVVMSGVEFLRILV